ncbi:two-component system response regulator [Spirochaetia bacterium]|nr:two-component system response regulator [Spirochaetia bacterium]
MKQILVIDESSLFREYIRLKLTENDVDVGVAINSQDGISKLRAGTLDLVILDYNLSNHGYLDVLKKKMENPNTVKIPVVLLAQRIDQKKIIDLIPYNVKKVFTKPVKIDALFAALAEILGIKFCNMDDSPGIVEVHVNDDIIFVEIAQGLNRDKLDLLRFKIIELIELYDIRVPKVIVMLSDMKLGFADTPNLQTLLETLFKSFMSKPRYIRILTNDSFVKQFVENQKEYSEIQVVSNLLGAMEGLLAELGKGRKQDPRQAQILGDKVLSAGENEDKESELIRFDMAAAPKKLDLESLRESIPNLKICIVDDDFVIRELIKNTFQKIGASVTAYSDGREFIDAMDEKNLDLLFLDILMPKVDGFGVLRQLSAQAIRPPVIVLSSVTQRETVIRAFQMGVKSYLTKPIKPDDIFKKAMEILKPNF